MNSPLPLLGLGLVLGLAMQLLLPAWMGEDELWHVEYATLIAQGHSPLGGDTPDRAWLDQALQTEPLSRALIWRRFQDVSPREIATLERELLAEAESSGFSRRVDWAPALHGATTFDELARGFSAAHQPPLYYIVVGTAARILGVTHPSGVLYVGRALALVFMLAMLLVTWHTARTLGLSPGASSAAGLVLILWPLGLHSAAVVNNDLPAALLASLALLAAAHALCGQRRTLAALGVFVAMVLAFAIKPTGLGAPLGALVALGLSSGTLRRATTSARFLALALFAALAVLYGLRASPVTPATLPGLTERLAGALEPRFWRSLIGTFTGTFNWQSRSLPTPILLAGFALLSTLVIRGYRAAPRGLVALLALPVLSQIALVMLRGVGIGRYLLPALPALALAVAMGYESAPPRRRPLLIALVAFASYSLVAGVFAHGHVLLELA